MLSGECFVIPITDANGGLYAAKLRPSPMCARADGPGSRQAILHPFDPKFCDVWGQAVAATYIHTYIQYALPCIYVAALLVLTYLLSLSFSF